MRTKHHAFISRALRGLGVALVALGCLSVNAQTEPPFKYNQVGNVTKFPPTTFNQGNMGGAVFGGSSSGDLVARGTQKIPAMSNKDVIIDVTAKVPKAKLGKLMLSATKLIPVLNWLEFGSNLLDFFKDSDIDVTKNPDGTTDFNGYRNSTDLIPQFSDYYLNKADFANPGEVCRFLWGPQGGDAIWGPLGNVVGESFNCSTNVGPKIGGKRQPDKIAEGRERAKLTDDEVIDVIARRVYPESNTKLDRAIKEALKTGQTVDTDSPTVTGPATQPVSQTQTQDVVNNTTNTQTTTNTFTYEGDTVTNNQQTTNLTINNTTNQVVSNTTTNTSNSSSTRTEVDMCKTNPDIAACMKLQLDTPEGEIPKAQKDVSYQEESIWGSGSCPADRIMTLHTGQTLKVWDFAKTCEAVNMGIAPILLLCSGYAAFLILALGSKGGL